MTDYEKGRQDAINYIKQLKNAKQNTSSQPAGSGASLKNPTPYVGSHGGSQSSQQMDSEMSKKIAELEDIVRKANEYDDSEEYADDIKNLGDEAADLADDIEDKGRLSPRDRARMARIKKEWEDKSEKANLDTDITKAKFKDKELRAARLGKVSISPLDRFLDSLQRFIRDELGYGREATWKRPSKRTVPGSDVLSKGRARNYNHKIPKLVVYFDQSGSWGEEDVRIGMQAIATLQQYEARGQLKIEVYYFAEHVHSNPNEARAEGGTGVGQELLDHIEEVGADNVIIMTDSDLDQQGDFSRKVTVDGAVWFLFRNGRSERLMDYLSGAKLTRSYDI